MKKKLLALMMVLAITLSFTPSLALPVAGDDTVPQETELQAENTESQTVVANDQKKQQVTEEKKADENVSQTDGQETTAPAVDGNTATVDLEGKGTQLAVATEGAETLSNVVAMQNNSTYVGTTYRISMTITPANAGTVTVNSENTPSGRNRTLTTNIVNLSATPESGYEFDHWEVLISGNGSGVVPMNIENNPCIIELDDTRPNCNITAIFKSSNTHSVNFDMSGHYAIPDPRTVADGDKLTFDSMTPALYTKATDGSGLELNGWMTEAPSTNSTYRDLCYDTGKNPPGKRWDFEGTSITKDTTLYTSWDGVLQLYTFDLSKNQSDTGGKVRSSSVYNTKEEYSASCGNTVIANTNATAYAQPNNGYTFVGWSTTKSKDNIVSNAAEYTFLFERKTTLYALFEEAQPTTLRLQYDDSQINSVKVNNSVWTDAEKTNGRTINAGTAVTIEVTPTASYMFSGSAEAEGTSTISGKKDTTNADGTGKVTFNMPGTDATLNIQAVEAVTLNYDVNGGTKGSNWPGDSVKVSKAEAGTASYIECPSSIDGIATAPEGQVYDGIEVTYDGGKTLRLKPGEKSKETATFVNGGTYKLMWKDKPVKLTLHWSSIDGKDLMDPIVIDNIEKGTKYGDVTIPDNKNLRNELFVKTGYKDSQLYRTRKPVKNYKSWVDVVSDCVHGNDTINEDTDIYVIMLKLIDNADVTVEAPVCGTVAKKISGEQTNTPKASFASGANYKVRETAWVKSASDADTVDEVKFKGDENYYAGLYLLPEFGYAFNKELRATVNGKTANVMDSSLEIAVAIGSVTAVHDWGDWEVTTEPTTTAVGIATKSCKVTDCTGKETREIPKVTYTCTEGNNSKWTLGSTGALGFRFVRSYKDAESFEKHFLKKVKVDGTELMPSDFTALDGSVRILLKDSFLNKLAEGEHSITVVYDDAEPSAKFSVVTSSAGDEDGDDSSKSKSKGVQTGDSADITYFIMLMLFGLSGIAFILARRREER